MKIYVIDYLKITNFVIPSSKDNFFSFNYSIPNSSNTCMLTFEKKDDKWYIVSNGMVNAYVNNAVVKSAELRLYDNIKIKILGQKNLITLCALPATNEKLYKLDISKINTFTVGQNGQCNICYPNQNMSPVQITFKLENGIWVMNAVENVNYFIYVNDRRVLKYKMKPGNIIFTMGLKIIWMNNFIIVNNPNNLVKINGLQSYNDGRIVDNTKYSAVSEEDKRVELYTENDYFFHTPRIKEIIEEEEIVIETPPPSDSREEMPWLLTIGSSITMIASAITMAWNVGNSLNSGKTFLSVFPQILMCLTMIFGSLIMPRIVAGYQKKKRKEKEEKRIRKFSEYLDQKELEIQNLLRKDSQIMHDNSLSVAACKNLNKNNRNFWSREIRDEDFLTVRLGIGKIDTPFKISAPIERFTLEDDKLLDRVHEIAKKYEKLENVPINISLLEKKITAFILNDNFKSIYIKSIIAQLITLQSALDLKIVILTNDANSYLWDFAKFLPHCWNEEKNFRFFATTPEEVKEVSTYLSEEFKKRVETLNNPNNPDGTINKSDEYKNFDCYYLILCDIYKNNQHISIIDDILKYQDKNYGFSFSLISNSLKNLPSDCNTFIEANEKEGCILERHISSKNQIFASEYDATIDLRTISNSLLNVPILSKEGLAVLPQSLSFLEMYGVSKIEQLNILNRWKTNNPVTGLSAPIGVYASGEQFKLNLHEKFHGPHGLIAGSTGSGKSEFIITYILSMCVNYHPDEVQFVLIDYKGGGLAGAFQNKETGVKIPHLVGTITNLDVSEMNRTLVSINSELKRRQKIFNETKDMLGESTIDIYKYQKFYREGSVKKPMAHLFIISDEFAELKAQQPEFMQELISTARIGRSLGVHLILATQKPSGVVNDQIWSNSKFKVCLKVQDRGDSMEMLKKPDAASIKEAGRFYLQVGYDDFFDKGQSGWAGAKYKPSDTVLKKVDDSLEYINNIGEVVNSIKDINVVKTDDVNYGDQLTNIVKNIYELGKRENINTNSLWLDSIPEKIYIDDLKKKYEYKPEPYVINPVIGEYDKPQEQFQGLLNVNLSKGNLIVWGQVGSGKENLISTLIWSICLEHTPQEVNIYILDFGAESLKMFRNMPHVGDVATTEEQEKILNTFIMVDEELDRRKELMADYGGSYKEYIENSGEKLPLITVIINNYEGFVESNSKLSESIQNFFRDGFKYGIVFVISAISTNAVRARSVQNFVNKICLQIPNEIDYRSVMNAPRGLKPARFFGRGLVMLEEGTVEFQTALFCEKKDIIKVVKSAAEQLNNGYNYKAPNIKVVPDVVYASTLEENVKDLSELPIGISLATKDTLTYNFKENKINNILTSKLDRNCIVFVKTVIDYCKKLQNVKLHIIDLYEIFDGVYNDIDYVSNNMDAAIINLNNTLLTSNDENETNLTIILGAGQLKNKLTPQGLSVLNNMFNKLDSLVNSYFIFVDTYSSIRNIQTEIWYQTFIDNTCGIWIGPEVSNQLAININDLSTEDKKNIFPYLAYSVKKGNYTIFKHVIEDEEA